MDMKVEGMTDALLKSKAKKRAWVNVIEHLVEYYYDRYDALNVKSRRMRLPLLIGALLGIIMLGVFIAFGTGGSLTNVFGGLSLAVMVGIAYMTTRWEKVGNDAEHCEKRVGELRGLEDLILSEPETNDTAGWFLNRYRKLNNELEVEYINSLARYGEPTFASAAVTAPVGDGGALLDTIDDLATTVAVTDLSDDAVKMVAKGVNAAIDSLNPH